MCICYPTIYAMTMLALISYMKILIEWKYPVDPDSILNTVLIIPIQKHVYSKHRSLLTLMGMPVDVPTNNFIQRYSESYMYIYCIKIKFVLLCIYPTYIVHQQCNHIWFISLNTQTILQCLLHEVTLYMRVYTSRLGWTLAPRRYKCHHATRPVIGGRLCQFNLLSR
jgi:hypothetical protein